MGKAKIQSTSQNAGAYLASLSDHEVASMFPMAKGRNWRKSSGKGKGRRGNPRGKNGEIMKEHLVNKRPQRSQSNTTLFIETRAPLSSQAAHDLPPGIISGTFLMVEEADPLQQNDPWSSQAYPMPQGQPTSHGPTRSHSYQGHMPQMPQMPLFQPAAPCHGRLHPRPHRGSFLRLPCQRMIHWPRIQHSDLFHYVPKAIRLPVSAE